MQQSTKKTSLVWFGNDLRISDNYVLNAAIESSDTVIGLYFLNPDYFKDTRFGFKKTDVFRVQFLLESLEDLKLNLQQLNISLLVLHESPEHILNKIILKHEVSTVYHQKEWTSEELSVYDSSIKTVSKDVSFKSYYNQFLYHPEDLSFEAKQTPRVFTHFRKAIEKSVKIRPLVAPDKMPETNLLTETPKIPTLEYLGYEVPEKTPDSAFPFEGGETQANLRLESYIFERKAIAVYKKTRNGLLGKNYSSKFSAWLANGSLSPRLIYWNVKKFETNFGSNESTYWMIFELIWRDYFKYISLKHGNSIFKIGGILEKEYDWNSTSDLINRWINGNTLDDFVNANMIELKKTGWMSNRGRQNVASYFSKTLELDWRIGAAYFESLLIDYDVHSNYGNWMYVSGVGNDPRNRVFNVKLQAERYDSNGAYRKKWLQTKLF